MKRLFFLMMFSLAITLCSFAQECDEVNGVTYCEICDNDIDDDGNNGGDPGVDCFDYKCQTGDINSPCKGGFVVPGATCTPPPSVKPKFTMTTDFRTDDETVTHLARVVVGDIDGDGIPEMVTANRYGKKIFIINGVTGKIKKSINTSFEPIFEEIFIANVDNKNGSCGEIFVVGGGRLRSYDCNLNTSPGWTDVSLPGDGGMIGITDFDSDGKQEIYVRDAIYDATTGVEIVESQAKANGLWDQTNGGPIAVDMDNLAVPTAESLKPELVIGCSIWDVNLGNRSYHSGSLTLRKSLPEYFTRTTANATSVADFDLDGHMDVIASGSTLGHGKNTTIFYWNPFLNTFKTFFDTSPGSYQPNGWKNGTGRINIADLDGDDLLDISYVSGKFLYALGNDLKLKPWAPKIVNEETSGNTGCTLFDFNGDGPSEIVYRDEKFLYIINGEDGKVYDQQICVSRTNREYPIVVDVDADGSTEICVTCRTVDFYPGLSNIKDGSGNFIPNDRVDFEDLPRSQYSQVRVFKSNSEPWVPARRVWNQHGYFIVNVKDNLKIPKQMQSPLTSFDDVVCNNVTSTRRPYNKFLNQSPYIDAKGCPEYVAADIGFRTDINITQPVCPEQNFKVSFGLINTGDLSANGSFPVTFYKGDPSLVTSVKLNTVTINLVNFQKGDTTSIRNAIVQGTGEIFQLFVVLNDKGTSIPPIDLTNFPNSDIVDCPANNIKDKLVSPNPAKIVLKSIPNRQCTELDAFANGLLKAYVKRTDGTLDSTGFTFYWRKNVAPITTLPVVADFTGGNVYSGLTSGQYFVKAVHKTANCSSELNDTVVVKITPPLPIISVVVNSDYTNCQAANGKMTATVNNGVSPENFIFEWNEGDLPGTGTLLSTSNIVEGLIALDPLTPTTYTVNVTEKTTNCSSYSPQKLYNKTPELLPALTPTPILCSSGDTGTLTASLEVKRNGVSVIETDFTNYTFNWYKGNNVKPTPDLLNPPASVSEKTNLAAGTYTLVVTENTSACSSAPVKAVISKTLPPTIEGIASNNQISCIPGQPSGSATITNDPLLFEIKWYNGQGTAPAFERPGTANLQSIPGLIPGFYTVKIKNGAGCTATHEFNILDGTTQLTPIPAPVPIIDCITPGSISVNGLTNPTEYTYFLNDGINEKVQPGNKLFSPLAEGNYTVWAINDITKCETKSVSVPVVNNVAPIEYDLDSALANKCNEKGTVKITITSSNTYEFKWFNNEDPRAEVFPEPSPDVLKISSIKQPTGQYFVVVKDNFTQCEREIPINIYYAEDPGLVLSKKDIDKCGNLKGGNIKITLIPFTTKNQDDYSLFVYEGKVDKDPLSTDIPTPFITIGTSGGNAPANYNTSPTNLLDDIFYTVVVKSPAVAPDVPCRVAKTIKINRTPGNITINSTVVNNNKCSLPKDGGNIVLTLAPDNDPNNYNITWVDGTNTALNLAQVSGFSAMSLSPDLYTVKAKLLDTAPANAGCEVTKKIPVLDAPQVIEIGPITLTPVTRCSLTNGFDVNPEGAAKVESIKEDGVNKPYPFSPYIIMWQNDSGPLSATNTNPLIDQPPGDYKVIIANTATGCQQTKDFTIENQTIGAPGVELVNFGKETRCTVDQLGFLEVAGTSIAPPPLGYSYTWYAGELSETDVAPPATPISVANTPFIGGLLGGDKRTVRVQNNSNNCWVIDNYTMTRKIIPIQIAANATPLVNCKNLVLGTEASISLFAIKVLPINIPESQFTFQWYIGNTPYQSSKEIDPLLESDFTEIDPVTGTRTLKKIEVQALSNVAYIDPITLEQLCVSNKIEVPINILRAPYEVVASSLLPVTICDSNKPNGMASAIVGTDFIFSNSRYLFEWFEGDEVPVFTPPNFPDFYGTGPTVDSLDAKRTDDPDEELIPYIVRATDRVTGCPATDIVELQYTPTPAALAGIEVLSDITNCVGLPANGSLKAIVDRPVDYVYSWSKKAGNNLVPIAAAQNLTTPVLEDLDSGVYVVTVKSNITQCEASASKPLLIKTVTPEFAFNVTDANCSMEDGFASLFLTNQVNIDSIWWDVTPLVVGPILANVPRGTYVAHVVTSNGCEASLPTLIDTEIHDYNFISRNGDESNSHFHVACIENFVNNNVKIYNRAGTLVYEANHYDNTTTLFDGRSNKGVNIMGNNLPAGTYFYIIDKRDGSKQIAGYLEIVD